MSDPGFHWVPLTLRSEWPISLELACDEIGWLQIGDPFEAIAFSQPVKGHIIDFSVEPRTPYDYRVPYGWYVVRMRLGHKGQLDSWLADRRDRRGIPPQINDDGMLDEREISGG